MRLQAVHRTDTSSPSFEQTWCSSLPAGLRHFGLEAPDALAVIGVDDIPTARVAAPPLTTIQLDLREAGRHRAETVVARLAGREPEAVTSSVSPHLVRRESA